jgi:hypothetical protein
MSERGTASGGRDNESEYDVKGPAPKGTGPSSAIELLTRSDCQVS